MRSMDRRTFLELAGISSLSRREGAIARRLESILKGMGASVEVDDAGEKYRKAFGAGTFKLPFGHRGGNHPVKDLETGRVYITSQNHGYAVDPTGLGESGLEVTHLNLNDGTVEGLRVRGIPAFSVQHHPEAGPGPHDAAYLFAEFTDLMDQTQ